MRDKRREKLQREVNKKVNDFNINIKNDPLWKGRYFARQVDAVFYNFEDGSGVEMKFALRFFDRKKNYFEDYYFNTFSGGVDWLNWKFFESMNSFIINSGVWEEDPRPTYDNTPDFRKEKF